MYISKNYTITKEIAEKFQKEMYNAPNFKILRNLIILIGLVFGSIFIWQTLSLGLFGIIFWFFSLIFTIPFWAALFIFAIPFWRNLQNIFEEKLKFFIDSKTTFSFQITPNQINFGTQELKYLDFGQLKMAKTENFLIFRQILYSRRNNIGFRLGNDFGSDFWIFPKSIFTKDELHFIYTKFPTNFFLIY